LSPRPAKPQRSCTTDSACPQSTGAGVHHPQNTLGSLRRDCALRRPTTRRGAEPRLIRCCGQIHNATLADYGVPAEGDYRRPGTHPEDSLAVVRSARTHLTYGEWLRRDSIDCPQCCLWKSCLWKTSQLIRSVRTATRFGPSAVSAAATPRFVHNPFTTQRAASAATGVSGP